MSKIKNNISKIKTLIYSKFFSNLLKKESIKKFSFDEDKVDLIKKDIQEKYNHHSELLDIFTNNKGLIVHKWHHYIPI